MSSHPNAVSAVKPKWILDESVRWRPWPQTGKRHHKHNAKIVAFRFTKIIKSKEELDRERTIAELRTLPWKLYQY